MPHTAPWTAEEDATLRRLFAVPLALARIALQVRRPRRQVEKRIEQLGLKRERLPGEFWTVGTCATCGRRRGVRGSKCRDCSPAPDPR